MTLHIVSLMPELFNNNGDAENARVLAKRAAWAGLTPEIHWVNDVTSLPAKIDLVVVGSGSDSDLPRARELLLPAIDRIRSWVTEKVALLAVGSGWELLSWGIERPEHEPVEGLGVFAGRAVPAEQRRVGDVVVESPWGQLVGFENHARDYVGAEKSTLGRVRSGFGNGRTSASGHLHEGVRMGTAIGTHLHGPVCAKNPGLADALLTDAAAHAGMDYEVPAAAFHVDRWAAQARERILASLTLDNA